MLRYYNVLYINFSDEITIDMSYLYQQKKIRELFRECFIYRLVVMMVVVNIV